MLDWISVCLCAARGLVHFFTSSRVLQHMRYVHVLSPHTSDTCSFVANVGRVNRLRRLPVDKLRRARGATIEAVWL